MSEAVTQLISSKEIQHRINQLAHQISSNYRGKTLTMVCVLKGGVIFMTDLAKKITIDTEFDFIETSSYGDSTKSSGVVRITKDVSKPVTGKNLLIVEDIIDTGNTLSFLLKHFEAQNPADIKICTLLDKPERRQAQDVNPEYIGFVIPDEFVVGYGLDYAERYRNLPYIGTLQFVD